MLYLVKGDLLDRSVDSIVVSSSTNFDLDGIIGKQIKEKCGNKLLTELSQLKPLSVGDNSVVSAYNLKCKKLFFVNTPIWIDGKHNEESNLREAYLNVLYKASDLELETVEFPILSSGNGKFPIKLAIKIAINTIADYLKDNDISVGLVLNSEDVYNENIEFFGEYKLYGTSFMDKTDILMSCSNESVRLRKQYDSDYLDLEFEGKTFSEILRYYIVIKNMHDIDVFEQIMSRDRFYKIFKGDVPNKRQILGMAVKLSLSEEDTRNLLVSAGYCFIPFDESDELIRICLRHRFDLSAINRELTNRNLPPLSSK